MLDILITGGRYPDYGEGKFKRANIGIRDGKIAYIGVRTPEAAQTIDARGQIVSPGFIDIHMHEENLCEGDRWIISEMMVKQGVTLAVGGNCGRMKQPVRKFKDLIRRFGGCPVNYALLSGYNYYRHNVLGFGSYEETDRTARDRIREYMLMDLDEGAFGISFGIEYDPGLTLDEILYGMALNYDEHLLVAAHYRYGGPPVDQQC